MHGEVPPIRDCAAFTPASPHVRERGIRAVILLNLLTMVAEIVAGYWGGSMAVLADGWHMATHVGALGLSAAAYALARHFAAHRAFAFGTGKVHALAGYTSAVALGLVALTMLAESTSRLLSPAPIDFASSLPVAIVGLVVNLLSVRLLHGEEAEHGNNAEHRNDAEDTHEHHHDHNHRAAVTHVLADILTSALAIAALLAGRWLGWTWLDPITGMVGGVIILLWGVGLCRSAAFELLNVDTSSRLPDEIRSVLEGIDDVSVRDLHVWSLGPGARACVVSLVSASPRDVDEYRKRVLGSFDLSHLTIEVQRCAGGSETQSSLERASA
jgi:cation diffusion facilitator family transporter